MSEKWIEVGQATYQLQEDGTVKVFSPSGYQRVTMSELPEEIQTKLKQDDSDE